MRLRRGFTYVEMSVVIMIIVIFAGLASPRIVSAIDSQRSVKYRRDLVDLFAYAREEAIRSGDVLTVTYDEEQFVVYAGGEDNSRAVKNLRNIPNLEVNDFILSGDTVSSSEWELNFYPNGEANSGRFTYYENGAERTFKIESSGLVSFVDLDNLSTYDDEKWEAGNSISTTQSASGSTGSSGTTGSIGE